MTPEQALDELESYARDQADTFQGQVYARELADVIRAALEVRERVLNLWDNENAWIPGASYGALADALGVPHKRMLTHRDGGYSRPGLDMRP